MNLTGIMEGILTGLGISFTISIVTLVIWLWKQGLRLDDHKKMIDGIIDNIKQCQSHSDCTILRESCMEKTRFRLEGLYSKIGDQIGIMDKKLDNLKDNLDEKVDLIIDRQSQIIKRIDDHIDKPK